MDLSSMLNDAPTAKPLPLLNTTTKQPLNSTPSATYSRSSSEHTYRDQSSPPYFPSIRNASPLSPTEQRAHPFAQPQHSREQSIGTNGVAQSQQQPLSPSSRFFSLPPTPLGPPPSIQKVPTQTSIPALQAGENYRPFPGQPIPSPYERDRPLHHVPSPEQLRRNSLQRRFTVDMDGNRSTSVSPKTIPMPSPHRQMSLDNTQHVQSSIITGQLERAKIVSDSGSVVSNGQPRVLRQNSEATSSSIIFRDNQASLPIPAGGPSPVSSLSQFGTPKASDAQLSSEDSPQARKQPSLKRNASVLSANSASPQPTRKRLRRSEIPIYAKSARPDKPPILSRSSIPPPSKPSGNAQPVNQSHPTPNTNGNNANPPAKASDNSAGEPSIFDMVPFEEIPQQICEWIDRTIGHAKPLPDGAVFEIEAKLGEIYDLVTGQRLRLPVATTTVFLKELYSNDTKFNSSMNIQQHQKLNKYLNDLVVRQSHLQSQGQQVAPIYFEHLREQDEFFELDHTDLEDMPDVIKMWLNKKHQLKVRRTRDQKTDTIKAQIIKSRIGDLDVYNPRAEFDYRISISIEIPWHGDTSLLKPATTSGRERKKDRMSYRHLAYQIDLTQVSSNDTLEKEHELEIEIDSEIIRQQLEQLELGVQPTTKYANFIPGLVHYVHGLCGKGSIGRR